MLEMLNACRNEPTSRLEQSYQPVPSLSSCRSGTWSMSVVRVLCPIVESAQKKYRYSCRKVDRPPLFRTGHTGADRSADLGNRSSCGLLSRSEGNRMGGRLSLGPLHMEGLIDLESFWTNVEVLSYLPEGEASTAGKRLNGHGGLNSRRGRC